MGIRFTLFNNITLLIMAFTLVTGITFARKKLDHNWPFLYYALILGYWKGFDGSLNTWWVALGVVCGVVLRFRLLGDRAQRVTWWLELATLTYVFLRCVDLVLDGELFYWLFPFTRA